MSSTAAHDFITAQRYAFTDLPYGEVEDLYSRRLWHQLTLALLALVRDPKADRGDNLLQLYNQFISTFEGRLSPLRVVQLVAAIARQYYPSRPYVAAELDRAVDLLTRQLSKREAAGDDALPDDAYLACRAEITSLLLKKATVHAAAAARGGAGADDTSATAFTALMDECKKRMEEEAADLASLPDVGVDPAVPATVHRAAAEYFKIRGPPHRFYASALLYLANTDLAAMPPADREALALDVAIAALVGEGVYNFGEVNAHPVLKVLEGTPHAWLTALLGSFQNGDIDRFNAVVAANKAAFDAQPALASSLPAIKEKITLLAVMELAARKPAVERVISFAELAAETHLPLEHMEWLLMRAMSLGLLKGVIDEVGQTVEVTFILPRVLDLTQVALLKDVVDAWRAKAHTNLLTLEDHLRDVFA